MLDNDIMCETPSGHRSINIKSWEIKPINNFIFSFQNKEILRLSEEKGFELNRDDFPDHNPNDFVKEFISILEKNFKIKFIYKRVENI